MKSTDHFVNHIDCSFTELFIIAPFRKLIVFCTFLLTTKFSSFSPELIGEEVVLHLEVVLDYPGDEGGAAGE